MLLGIWIMTEICENCGKLEKEHYFGSYTEGKIGRKGKRKYCYGGGLASKKFKPKKVEEKCADPKCGHIKIYHHIKGSECAWLGECKCKEFKPKVEGCGKELFEHPDDSELKCYCGDSMGYFCEKCKPKKVKEELGCDNLTCRNCKIVGCDKYIEDKDGDFICGKNYLCPKCKPKKESKQ